MSARHRPAALARLVGLVALAPAACGREAPATDTTAAAASLPAPAPAGGDHDFASFDSTTLVATCRHAVTAAEDSAWRPIVSRIGGHPGVLVYANPARDWRCFQLGVTSAEVRDSLSTELARAGVPSRVVTFFHVTRIPEDDITAGARAPDTAARPRP